MNNQAAWVEWLVKIGYPYDMSFPELPPPCTSEELAAEWARFGSDAEVVADYVWSIEVEAPELKR